MKKLESINNNAKLEALEKGQMGKLLGGYSQVSSTGSGCVTEATRTQIAYSSDSVTSTWVWDCSTSYQTSGNVGNTHLGAWSAVSGTYQGYGSDGTEAPVLPCQ